MWVPVAVRRVANCYTPFTLTFTLKSTDYTMLYPQNGDRIVTTDCVEELLSRLRCSPVYSNDVTSPYATLRDPSHVYATVRNVNWSTDFAVCQQFLLKTSIIIMIIKWKLYTRTHSFLLRLPLHQTRSQNVLARFWKIVRQSGIGLERVKGV